MQDIVYKAKLYSETPKVDMLYLAIDEFMARASICSVFVPVPYFEPASCLIGLTCKDSFLQNAKGVSEM